ncbi:MAG: hypothetical protein Q8W51_02810, partial [Candidatus Palauibacterales bacterium]|nr:hypothetical protein [Candidatus Palauibacterales bacterium]
MVVYSRSSRHWSLGVLRNRRSEEETKVKASEVAEKLGFVPSIRTIKDLSLAPDGTVWIQRKVIGRGTPGPIDVLSPQGEYLVHVATSMITYRSGATRGSAVSLPHTQGGGDDAAEKPVHHRSDAGGEGD